MIGFSNYANYDIPQFLSAQLISKFNLDQEDLNTSYISLYLVGIISIILTPSLIQKFKASLVALISCFFIASGCILSLYGVMITNYSVVIYGRVIFGIGCMSCFISVAVILEKWFKEKMLTFAMSLMDFMNIGAATLSSFFTLPIFVKYRDIDMPFVYSGFVGIGSCIAALIIYIVDEMRDRRIEKEKFEFEKKLKETLNPSLDVEELNTFKSETEVSFDLFILRLMRKGLMTK